MVSYKELIGFVWKFMRQQKWIFLFILALDCLAWPVDALLWPYILHLVIDIFTSHETAREAAWGLLQGPLLAGVCLVIYIEIASRAMGFSMARAIPKLQEDLRMAMFDHVQRHSPRYFSERFAGSLSNKLSDMTTQVELILQQIYFPIAPAISACLLGAVFLWFVHPLFAWMLLLWIAIHLSVCILFTRKVDVYEHEHGEARSTLLGKIVDSFTNNFAVNLFYRFSYEKRLLTPFQNEERSSNVFARRYVEKMRCVLSVFFFLGVILGIFGPLVYLWLHHKISTGGVVQVFTMMWALAFILWNVSGALPVLFQAFGLAKQAYSVMQEPSNIEDPPAAKELQVRIGEIAFENVTFHYKEKKLFENKHVVIRGKQKVGLVGYTGAGKSTFVSLILRLFPLQSGKILIDGQEVARVTLKSLRRQIALIPQDPILFHRTLRENILYGKPDAKEEEIFEAARLAHCDEFIRSIPNGYEAKVGERGTKLSGGEKQRIAIARAFLAKTPILLLDEATSSLDSLTEKYIQESLEKLMEGRTTIVIAHRLSTLSHMDRILVFDKGKIVEDGDHASLLAKDGLYGKMWKMQVGGFLPESA